MSPEILKHVQHLREIVGRQAHDIELLTIEHATVKAALITEINSREAAERRADEWERMYDRLKSETGVTV